MVYITIGIIAVIIMLLFFVIMLILTRNTGEHLNTVDSKGKILDQKGEIDKEAEIVEARGKSKTVSAKTAATADPKAAIRREDMFKLMEFDRILDGMIVQKNGSRFTKAIKCKGINYDLMSEVEQLAVEEGFITFLNTLKYPIQLYVQAENIDLSRTIKDYEHNIEGLKNEYNSVNEKYQKMASSFDVDEIELKKISKDRDSLTNVYEYAVDMIKNVEKMNRNKRMLQRNFYILLSYNTSEITSVEKFNKTELIEMCSTELTTRCQAVLGALASCSVTGNVLDSNELAQLLYNAYNRDDASMMNIKDSLESGFYRLYTVSEDAFYKKQQELEAYLEDKARLKALEAIKKSILNDEYKTPAREVLEEEEETSKRATNMINHEDYEPEIKKKVNKIILDDFRETKKALLEQDAEQKQIYLELEQESEGEMKELQNKINDFESKNPMVANAEKNRIEAEKKEQQLAEAEKEQDNKTEEQQKVDEAQNVQLYDEQPQQPAQEIPNVQPMQQTVEQEIPNVQPVQQPIYEQPVQPVQPVQQEIPQQEPVSSNPTPNANNNTSNDEDDDDNIII